MHKFNVVITTVLTVIAVLLWGGKAVEIVLDGGIGRTQLWEITKVFTMLACVGWILVTIASSRQDDYTRCRRCRHILRGITEPRCPECGEPI